MQPKFENCISKSDEFAAYAAPVLLELSAMARKSKHEFAAYLLEVAVAELVQSSSSKTNCTRESE